MKAKVDENLCVGTMDCQDLCPQVFQIVDGVATVLVDEVPKDAEEACRKAADNCPTGAITIEE